MTGEQAYAVCVMAGLRINVSWNGDVEVWQDGYLVAFSDDEDDELVCADDLSDWPIDKAVDYARQEKRPKWQTER